VTEEKLCLWLSEDILIRHVLPSKGRAKAPRKRRETVLGKRKREEEGARAVAAVLGEVEELAKELDVPVEAVPEMLADDRLDYEAPGILGGGDGDGEDDGGEGVSAPIGSPYTVATVDAYVAAVIELYDLQRSNGSNRHPHPRGQAVAGLLGYQRCERDQNDRDAFVDRGIGGITAGYNAEELLRMQELLLHGAKMHPQASLSFHPL
jgi:hypothetical protein